MRRYIEWEKPLHFLSPIDGDCLNEYDGTLQGETLTVPVKVAAPAAVTINGIAAVPCDGGYVAQVEIPYGKSTLRAECGGETAEITVWRLQKSIGYYRLSSDDNIYFLWDINKNKDTYTSIFDNPYLAVYKKAHDLYGAAVHLNIYYEMPAVHECFTEEREYFDLSMMTDKFKAEWEANADWLKLNFHAKQDKPDKPYIRTDYATIYEDCKKVQQEILRFAGEKTLSEETTVHWGECTYEGVRALRDLGVKNLAGYFVIENGATVVSYFYPKYFTEHINGRDFWYDSELDVLYAKIDKVLNLHTADESVDLLNVLYEQKHRAGFIELMIHEEYFLEDFAPYPAGSDQRQSMYMPDFEERVLKPCKWAADHGYKGAFIHDIR